MNSLVIQHRTNLSDDLSRGQITLYPEQCGQAKLAIHGTTDLTGNTDRSAVPAACFFNFISSLAPVSSLAAIAFWHPNRFHTLAVGEADEVADRAIAGYEFLFERRNTER